LELELFNKLNKNMSSTVSKTGISAQQLQDAFNVAGTLFGGAGRAAGAFNAAGPDSSNLAKALQAAHAAVSPPSPSDRRGGAHQAVVPHTAAPTPARRPLPRIPPPVPKNIVPPLPPPAAAPPAAAQPQLVPVHTLRAALLPQPPPPSIQPPPAAPVLMYPPHATRGSGSGSRKKWIFISLAIVILLLVLIAIAVIAIVLVVRHNNNKKAADDTKNVSK
jgi:hypothetical protein